MQPRSGIKKLRERMALRQVPAVSPVPTVAIAEAIVEEVKEEVAAQREWPMWAWPAISFGAGVVGSVLGVVVTSIWR